MHFLHFGENIRKIGFSIRRTGNIHGCTEEFHHSSKLHMPMPPIDVSSPASPPYLHAWFPHDFSLHYYLLHVCPCICSYSLHLMNIIYSMTFIFLSEVTFIKMQKGLPKHVFMILMINQIFACYIRYIKTFDCGC